MFYIESALQDVFVYKAGAVIYFFLTKKSCFLKSALLVKFWIQWYSNILNFLNILRFCSNIDSKSLNYLFI